MGKELCGINYEQAIEARAKINGLPNLHLLIGKSNDDGLYRAFCLDSGIICISNSSELNENTINYLFEESCILALNQFYRYVKEDKSLLLAGRCSNREYWDIYDELILPVKQKSLISILEQVEPFEELIPNKDIHIDDKYEKSFKMEDSQDQIRVLMQIIVLLLIKKKKMYLKIFYEKEALI
ncbi:hypothetical protein [Brachyspira hyodysenteriae]|uniref:hypothetical protein n=1 Tax=Brachyspira hyodysenteriae TaxID=159 RepID=UPI00063DD364|nr:hypothetical protein [Brachyspira hyodysenteriae]KLI19485.1 hypothetical protein SU45_00330 [Brachyspira hyodysenteriae]KLI62482.1 hypothetical protein SZ46_01380 [Brachyspira hyodysenteriae]